MPSDEDACNVCEGDRSTLKNPIIFCDGKGCNMPVHKRCYSVEEIPDDDWFCDRCDNKRKKKPTIIVCCPMQTGAVKRTDVTGEFIHVVCAMWNTSIDEGHLPYSIPISLLDIHECYFCSQKKGLTIQCNEPGCQIYFHVTCAINNSLITPAAIVPPDFSPRCIQHQFKANNRMSVGSKKGRRLRPSRDYSDNDSENDDSNSEEDLDSEEEEEKKEKKRIMMPKKKQKLLPLPPKPIATSPPPTMKKEILNKSIFFGKKKKTRDDDDDSNSSSGSGSSSSSDDDMGTSSSNKMKSTNKVDSLAITTTTTTTTHRSSEETSHRERLEAKRMNMIKPGLLSTKEETKSFGGSAMSVNKSSPNIKTLVNNTNNNGIRTNIPSPTTTTTNTTTTPPLRKFKGPSIIKDIEVQNDARQQQQRWNNSNSNNNNNPVTPSIQPTTPYGNNSNASFFEKEFIKSSQRKSIDSNADEAVKQLKEQVKKLTEFKKSVAEVFQGLNVPFQGTNVPSATNDIEGYVSYLQSVLKRVGPIREQDRIQIQDYVTRQHTS
ncbi:MAG: hypothetical protein EXX96DRAFT_623362 [Benjaminiella poitrasii]|nr:MAG: hypothetical protein EXX96DRAFT_623362 [Benjaminiella poitrasii]